MSSHSAKRKLDPWQTVADFSAVVALFILLPARVPAQETPNTEDLNVAAVDASLPGSPFALSGSVQFHDEFSSDSIQTRFAGELKLRNISTKAVVAYELTGDVGIIHLESSSFDAYFRGNDIQPEAEVSAWKQDWQDRLITVSCRAPCAAPTHKVRIAVVYAEFADGSKFGDGKFAESRPADRRRVLTYLNQLSDAYENGPVNLLPTLNGLPTDRLSDWAVIRSRILDSLFSQGADGAATEIRAYLSTAARRGFID
jgi:hypothetical protein